LDVIRRRYGEALYQVARDAGREWSMMDKFRQIVDLDRSSDLALTNTCDVSDDFIQAVCEVPRFKVRTLSVLIGPLSEVVRDENIEGIEAYSATGDYEVFNRKYDRDTLLSIPLEKYLREGIPVNIEVVRALLNSPFDFRALEPRWQSNLLRQYILQGQAFFELFEEKGLVSIQSRNEYGRTPLMIVARKDPEDPVYLRNLLAKDRSVLNVQARNGSTALMEALDSFANSYDNARVLLSDPSIDVNIEDADGESAVTRVLEYRSAPPDDVIQTILNKTTITPDLIDYANSPEALEILLDDYGLGDERYRSYVNRRYTKAIVDLEEDIQEVLEVRDAVFALSLLDENLREDVLDDILFGGAFPGERKTNLYQRILNDTSLSEERRANIRKEWEENYPCAADVPERFFDLTDIDELQNIIATYEVNQKLLNKRYAFARLRDTPEEQQVAQFLKKTYGTYNQGAVCFTDQEKRDFFYDALERDRVDLARLIADYEDSIFNIEFDRALRSYQERMQELGDFFDASEEEVVTLTESEEDFYSPRQPSRRGIPLLLQQLRQTLRK
jgi:hypothetical protein